MLKPFKAACVQTNSLADVGPNIEAVTPLVRAAAAAGARFILLPENVAMMEEGRRKILAKAWPEPRHPALPAFQELARETGAWLLVGSLAIKPGGGGDRVTNRSFLMDAQGGIAARYDKLHLFDVDIEGEKSYRESATFHPGKRAVLAQTPWGALGMTICYDLRFPHLYRTLAKSGAHFFSVPSAFTRVSGRAHWHVLLRARAIETGCFVFAPAQCGDHECGRQTYGHSLIIDPWGKILAEAEENAGFIAADIDPARVDEARRMIPALKHDREFIPPASS